MTKVRITRAIAKTKWQLVTFNGPAGGEAVGIVDMLAIRKDHATRKGGLKRGYLFEVVVIQVKGGSAAFPSREDVDRLRKVGNLYRAKGVLLAQWVKGRQVDFFELKQGPFKKDCSKKDYWTELAALGKIFH